MDSTWYFLNIAKILAENFKRPFYDNITKYLCIYVVFYSFAAYF